ncbi:MAG: hypothetical protein WD988_03925 [Candidatus Curtissbacteria bacterium]
MNYFLRGLLAHRQFVIRAAIKSRSVHVFFAIVVLFVATRFGGAEGSGLASPLGAQKNMPYLAAEAKIAGDDSWKPKGWGTGEYIDLLPIIHAGAVIDMNSGEVLWSMNLNKKIAPASLTKLATVMTALDLFPKDKTIRVSQSAADQVPTKLGLIEGEKLSLDEAIKAAILTSANDATEAISDSLGKEVGDGTSTFMKLVNTKLAKIGANNTHFETSTGLDHDNHFSTIYDLAIIAHAAKSNYPLISEAASQDYARLAPDSNHKLFDLPNWNALLGTYPGVNGLKIGYTGNAGHSTIVTANREGRELMAIVTGANSLENREIAAAMLLNYGFSKHGVEPYAISDLDLVSRYEDWHRQLSVGEGEEAQGGS